MPWISPASVSGRSSAAIAGRAGAPAAIVAASGTSLAVDRRPRPDRPLQVEIWEDDGVLRGGDDHYGTITIVGDEAIVPGATAYCGLLLIKDANPALFSPSELLMAAEGELQATFLLVYTVT